MTITRMSLNTHSFAVTDLMLLIAVSGIALMAFLPIFDGVLSDTLGPILPVAPLSRAVASAVLLIGITGFGWLLGVRLGCRRRCGFWAHQGVVLGCVLLAWLCTAPFVVPAYLHSERTANEAACVEACNMFVDAQSIYRRTDWDRDGVLEYAQATTGDCSLYERTSGKADLTLLTESIAGAFGWPEHAAAYRGYRFKILKQQGVGAPGGRLSYLDERNNLTQGYALLACPSRYGITGYSSFQLNNSGLIYSKDLGPNSAQIFNHTKAFNLDSGWQVAE